MGPFLVIKYKFTVPFFPDMVGTEWAKVYPESRIISERVAVRDGENVKIEHRRVEKLFAKVVPFAREQDALRLIKSRGLILAHSDEDGDVYDTEDYAFLNEYGGKFTWKNEID